jgi:hypothetical protein
MTTKWTTLQTDREGPAVIEVGEYVVLGSLRRRGPYVGVGALEFLITGQVSTIGLEGGRPGDTWFASRDGDVLRGVEVPAGTFAKDKAAEERAAANVADTRPRRHSILAGLPALAREPERFDTLGPDHDDPRLSAMSKGAKLIHRPAREADTSPEAIDAYYRARGLSVVYDEAFRPVDVLATKGIVAADLDLIEKAAPLHGPWKAGKPARCASGKHKGTPPVAVDLAAFGRALCHDSECWRE